MKSYRDVVGGVNNERILWDTLEDVMRVTVNRVKILEGILIKSMN